MRLINAHTLKLEEFLNEKGKPYAILSHRWGNGEMSLLDMQSLPIDEPAESRGFVKIKYACEQAVKDGHEYVWVDTCCINKDSSAELSEAINSMYRWYQRAAVCYVFLSDVVTVCRIFILLPKSYVCDIPFFSDLFARKRELLDPSTIYPGCSNRVNGSIVAGHYRSSELLVKSISTISTGASLALSHR